MRPQPIMNHALLANFPHLFPEAPSIQSLEGKRSKYCARGDGGREEADEEIICDEDYLDSIKLKLKYIELKATMWKDKCTKYQMSPISRNFDSKTHLQEALTELADITKHIRRLRDNPILFGDSRTREEFFLDATQILRDTVEVLQQQKQIARVIEAFDAEQHRATSHTLRLPSGRPVPPWLSWATPLARQAATIYGADVQYPGYTLARSQVLPAQGVLITEYWRKQIDDEVLAAAQVSSDPQRVLKQRPGPLNLNRTTELQSGKVFAKIVTKSVPPPMLTSKSVECHGEQEPVEIGRSSRMLAKIFGHETTVGIPVGVMKAYFTSEKVDRDGFQNVVKEESGELEKVFPEPDGMQV